jgi:hypothetical protein
MESKMSLTNPKDFQTLLSLIPKERRENVWMIPIRANNKLPDVPAGTKLHDAIQGGNEAYRLSFSETLHRLKWGSNYAIYALPGGLCFLDLDAKDGKLLASQDFLDALESIPTLTIRTSNGGIHKYFLNNGEYPNQSLKNEQGEEIWSFRGDWYYVLGAGSHATPIDENSKYDGTYRIIEERPIAQFQGFGDYFKKNEEVEDKELKTFSKKTDKKDEISIEEHNKTLAAKGKSRRLISSSERKCLQLMREL